MGRRGQVRLVDGRSLTALAPSPTGLGDQPVQGQSTPTLWTTPTGPIIPRTASGPAHSGRGQSNPHRQHGWSAFLSAIGSPACGGSALWSVDTQTRTVSFSVTTPSASPPRVLSHLSMPFRVRTRTVLHHVQDVYPYSISYYDGE